MKASFVTRDSRALAYECGSRLDKAADRQSAGCRRHVGWDGPESLVGAGSDVPADQSVGLGETV